MPARDAIQLGGTNFGYLYAHGLDASLEHLASVGVKVVELGLAPPHFDLESFDAQDCRRLRQRLDGLGLVCSSVNLAELNLITQNRGFAALALRQYHRAIEIAAEIGAGAVVVVPGRQHPLRPTPEELAMARFRAVLMELLQAASARNLILALETVPFGFLETAKKLADFVDQIGHPLLRLALDSANMFMVEDPAQGVLDAAGKIYISHVSDAWKRKWAHTSIGRGEIDFAAFHQALERVNYQGVTIYELMDAEDPVPRLAHDLGLLQSKGWSLVAPAGRA